MDGAPPRGWPAKRGSDQIQALHCSRFSSLGNLCSMLTTTFHSLTQPLRSAILLAAPLPRQHSCICDICKTTSRQCLAMNHKLCAPAPTSRSQAAETRVVDSRATLVNPLHKLHVLWHEGHTFGVDCSQIRTVHGGDKSCFRRLLARKHRSALETKRTILGLVIRIFLPLFTDAIANLPEQSPKRRLSNQELVCVLEATNLAERNSPSFEATTSPLPIRPSSLHMLPLPWSFADTCSRSVASTNACPCSI